MVLLLTASEAGGGFNPLDPAGFGNFFWTLVIFLTAVPVIWKMVMGPIVRALEERDDHAARAIAAAEKASAAAERAKVEVEVALGEAQAEAAKLLARARERAEVREHEIIDAAKHEAAGLLDAARIAIQAEQDKAISAIRNEVVELSLGAASKVLERKVGSEDDRRMVAALVSAGEPARN